MMDYEKKYKEALQKIRELIERGIENGWTILTYKKDFEKIFPELKESEDERIRKELIEYHRSMAKSAHENRQCVHEAWIAWLEKQESVGEIVERCKESWYNEGKIAGMAEGLSDEEKYQQGWHDALEKQGEKSQRMISAEAKEALYDKPAWSGEDERICNFIISDIANDRAICKYELSKGVCDEQINWLKSLKDRVGCEVNCTTKWKPSEEQMRMLKEMVVAIIPLGEVHDVLETLYDDLNKLRKE